MECPENFQGKFLAIFCIMKIRLTYREEGSSISDMMLSDPSEENTGF
jgi:hypothetical protein